MKKREKQLRELVKQPSILAGITELPLEWEQLIKSSEFRSEIASALDAKGTEPAKTRAAFIRNQDATNFNANREAWGIPAFLEELVEVSDFENGFMWRFRAHTTSWSENQHADQWFLTSLEARSISRYEFWSCDEGPDKLEFVIEGNYKSILSQLLAEQVYEVLISPVFSSEELDEYIANFSEDEEDYELEEVIEEYISQNPNYLPAK
ncbi:MAG TPA: hypothetical protein VFO93_03445 [Hymenobacter sp.]|uniref:hypothetical protein n=1 Tax=Hymenobacter sp. TaxID=1898978 RepID=UPI002D7FA705|nr:hypothetical protein [Hymenobacter sp.]HET9502568.1 hypothetical protein [Hymenobacter sp.]